MKLINSSAEIIPQASNLLGVYKQIEIAGRTCYKSEDKITETSAVDFVDMLIKRGHTAPLEHGTIYLKIPMNGMFNQIEHRWDKYQQNSYSKVVMYADNVFNWNAYITTNARVIYENNWQDDLEFLCNPTDYHELRTTVRFTISIGIANEFVRHRVFSFCQESSRYCNYSKEKYGNELTFIKPYWYVDSCTTSQRDIFLKSLQEAENSYLELLKSGLVAQQAREVLPKAVKTELVMTGFNSDWKNFFELRSSNAAHPDARNIVESLKLIW